MIDWISVEDEKPDRGRQILLRNETAEEIIATKWDGSCSTKWVYWAYDNPPVKRRWKPSIFGTQVWSLDGNGDIAKWNWSDCCYNHQKIIEFLGVYKTKEEAEAMRDKLREFVKTHIGEC